MTVVRIRKEWDNSPSTPQQLHAKAQSRQLAAIKRERALAYAFSEQLRRGCPIDNTNIGKGMMKDDRNHWAWKWLERWMAARPWESSCPDLAREHISVLMNEDCLLHRCPSSLSTSTKLDSKINNNTSLRKRSYSMPLETMVGCCSALINYNSPSGKLPRIKPPLSRVNSKVAPISRSMPKQHMISLGRTLSMPRRVSSPSINLPSFSCPLDLNTLKELNESHTKENVVNSSENSIGSNLSRFDRIGRRSNSMRLDHVKNSNIQDHSPLSKRTSSSGSVEGEIGSPGSRVLQSSKFLNRVGPNCHVNMHKPGYMQPTKSAKAKDIRQITQDIKGSPHVNKHKITPELVPQQNLPKSKKSLT